MKPIVSHVAVRSHAPHPIVLGYGGNRLHPRYLRGRRHWISGPHQGIGNRFKHRHQANPGAGTERNRGISDPAFEKIPALILEHQSVAVDAVAGCTNSSRGLIEAGQGSPVAAGATEEMISKEIAAQEAGELETQTADVVIIGAGGAGMTAAVEALRAGGGVLIVEKMTPWAAIPSPPGQRPHAAGSDIQKTGTMAASGVEAIGEKLALEPGATMKRWQESVRQDLDAIASRQQSGVSTPRICLKLQAYVNGIL